MIARLMALAMNENLTDAEFLALTKQVMDSQEAKFEVFKECVEKLHSPEERLAYINAVMPMLLS